MSAFYGWVPTFGPLVFVEEAAEDGSAPDLRLGEIGDRMVGPGRAEVASTVGSAPVVVGRVLGYHDTQVAFAEDQHPVCDLGPRGEHESLRKGVRARAPGWDLHSFDACAAQGRVEGIGELPGTVADQELEVRGAVTEVHQEVADLLGSPRAVRVRGNAEDMHVMGVDLDYEQHVQALEGHRAIHMEEVGCQHGCGLEFMNWRHVVSVRRLGAGGIFRALRTRWIVDALTR
jgi:hypothetical protein